MLYTVTVVRESVQFPVAVKVDVHLERDNFERPTVFLHDRRAPSYVDGSSVVSDVLILSVLRLHVPVERVALAARVIADGAPEWFLVRVLHLMHLQVLQLAERLVASRVVARHRTFVRLDDDGAE